MNWIDVNEKMPNDGEEVLLCDSKGNMKTGYFRFYDDRENGVSFGDRYASLTLWRNMGIEFTHWCAIESPYSND